MEEEGRGRRENGKGEERGEREKDREREWREENGDKRGADERSRTKEGWKLEWMYLHVYMYSISVFSPEG